MLYGYGLLLVERVRHASARRLASCASGRSRECRSCRRPGCWRPRSWTGRRPRERARRGPAEPGAVPAGGPARASRWPRRSWRGAGASRPRRPGNPARRRAHDRAARRRPAAGRGALPPLRGPARGLVARGARAAPAGLHHGARGSDGVHTASAARRAPAPTCCCSGCASSCARLGGGPPAPATDEVPVRLGRDRRAPLTSTLPFGFRDFCVEVLGARRRPARRPQCTGRLEDSGATSWCAVSIPPAVDEAVSSTARVPSCRAQRGAGDADDRAYHRRPAAPVGR